MAFQFLDFPSIVASMLNHLRGNTDKITDFRPGSVARSLVEAPAVAIEELYQQMFIGLRESIPVATFLSFGFGRLTAARAYGTLTITRAAGVSADLVIPIGTVFSATDGRKYTTTTAVTWPKADQTITVQIQASDMGTAGNASAGLITSTTFDLGAVTITNAPLTNGRDEETDAEREARFADYIKSISRGTEDAVRYAVAQAQILNSDGDAEEYVTRVGMIEEPGHVRLYVYSSKGVPTAALLARGQAIIDGYTDSTTGVRVAGYRSAGVRIDVLPMIETTVTFGVQVAMLAGYSLTVAVTNSMVDLYDSLVRSVQSGSALFVGDVIEAFLTVPGVRRVVPIVSNNQNIPCAENEVLLPGALSVSALDD